MAFQPLDVNKEAVKTLCIKVGVREAARQMGIPQATVQAWSARFKWFNRNPKPVLPPSEVPATTNATSPSNALQNMLEANSKATKLDLSKATRKAAATFARKKGQAVIDEASQLRQIAAAASTVHGWNDKADGGINLQLGIMLGGMD